MKKVCVLRHVPHEGLGTLAPALEKAGLKYAYVDVWKKTARLPRPDQVRALVVMGGPMGVYEKDKYPFLKKEVAFIRQVLRRKTPFLGICLGSQLLAGALGAEVYKNKRKEIGWYPLDLTAEGKKDPFFRAFPARSTVFQWHGDTFDLPRGAAHLARSPLCRHQAFRFGENAYGLQFHIEVDAAMIREWLAQPGTEKELAAVGPQAMRKLKSGIRRGAPQLKKLAAPFFQAFTETVREV